MSSYADFIEELKSKCDVVSVVSRYVTLNRKGRRHWGCCPFHHEKTPSFSVVEEGYYKCFGCGAAGDVIKFVMEIESVDFLGAVQILAKSVNMAVPEFSGKINEDVERRKKERDRLFRLMKDACNFYYAELRAKKEKSAMARGYLVSRGFDGATLKKFMLGYSPDYGSLCVYLRDKGYTDVEMLSAGVAQRSKNGGVIDAQAGRIIIPILNVFGDPIAFGGRLLEKKPDFAKYKNTNETSLFEKKKNLYNVHNVKKLKQTENVDRVIMVEGYMDVIALDAAGFRNVVASMGTSLTVDQARLLKRMTERVVICYDGDSAGQSATIRGMEILAEQGLTVSVISLPDGLDPDELVSQRGAEAFEKCISDALPLIDYKMNNVASKYDLSTSDGKRRYASEAIRAASELDDKVSQEDCLKKIRALTGFTYESLSSDLRNYLEQKEKGGGNVGSWQITASVSESVNVTADVNVARVLLHSLIAGIVNVNYVDAVRDMLRLNIHRKIADYIAECRDKGTRPTPSAIFNYADCLSEESVSNGDDVGADDESSELVAVLEEGDKFTAFGDGAEMGAEKERAYFFDVMRREEIRRVKEDIDALSERYKTETDETERGKIGRMLLTETNRLKELNKKTR